MKAILTHSFFKNFILKLVLFAVVVFVSDRVAGLVLKHYYFKQQGGYDFLTTEAIDKTKAELLVFGSSRAVNIFDTDILRERSGLSSYNAGRYGEPIFYHYAVLKSVLKRYKPKLIILSFDAGNFSKNEEAYDKISVLLPYYQMHPEMKEIIEMKSTFEKIKLLSASYPYNSLVLSIITGNKASSKIKYTNTNGYIPIKRTISGQLKSINYNSEKDLDTVKINTYTSFIIDCKAANIPLYIVCPPYMLNATGEDKSIVKAEEIASKYGINFMNFTTDTFYTSKRELFADFRHLNEDGVEYFVHDVMDAINPALLINNAGN